MITFRTTFYRRTVSDLQHEVITAADFDSSEAAHAAGRDWVAQDVGLNSFEVTTLLDRVAGTDIS